MLVNRKNILIRGIVQGVGFRPFVYKLATELNLTGIVANENEGVRIEIEGPDATINDFIQKIKSAHPPRAVITEISVIDEDSSTVKKYETFEIHKTVTKDHKNTIIPPDYAVCDTCLKEISDSQNLRFRYPFTSCTDCGPRYSIIRTIPYDRSETTMAEFPMCSQCQLEYDDPNNRRFHAEANACRDCGPKLQLQDIKGNGVESDDLITKTVALIRQDKIIAIKGVGGFHLVCDASSDIAVQKLRARKKRNSKPFALLAKGIEEVKEYCNV